MIPEVARALHGEVTATNERRMLVLHGARDATHDAARAALDELDILPATGESSSAYVSDRDDLPMPRISPRCSEDLLGTTKRVIVYDAFSECRPNTLGRISGAVDGGGLLILCTPPLDAWPSRHDGFDEGLAVPPFEAADVTGYFRTRLVDLLRAHRGIAIVDVDGGVVESDGRTNPAPRLVRRKPGRDDTKEPSGYTFPDEAYEACLTSDQASALHACESLRSSPTAVVLEADRGRGKSSAIGLAAACFANDGDDVLVTAPGYQNAAEGFERARELLTELGTLAAPGTRGDDGESSNELQTTGGGRIRFERPPDAIDAVDGPESPTVVIVDEAASIPVRILDDLLACDRIAFATTVHGYEGAGRGFDVRFRDHLSAARHEVTDITLTDPIRYAAGDPIEVWSFRTLALDARPVVDQLVDDAVPDSATYTALPPAELVEDEQRLREAFGLLVYAHYRTEPNDLARLLDAPNLTTRALVHDGHVVAVALLAREGGLDADLRSGMYEGGRVRGNMLPDVLTSQLRDEDAAIPVGYRVMRIATHPACRNRGIGSRLLSEVRTEFQDDVDWLGVGYGATPGLVDFWRQNGYSTLHVSTTRNDTSGEYSAIMLDPTSRLGERLHDRHAGWFSRRISGVLTDLLRDLDPDVTRACLRACDATPELGLGEDDWRLIAACAYGPAMYAVDPAPFERLAMHHLMAGDPDVLTADQERLLVAAALQHRSWQEIVEELDYHSHATAMRAFGRTLQPLVDTYGSDAAHQEATRHRE